MILYCRISLVFLSILFSPSTFARKYASIVDHHSCLLESLEKWSAAYSKASRFAGDQYEFDRIESAAITSSAMLKKLKNNRIDTLYGLSMGRQNIEAMVTAEPKSDLRIGEDCLFIEFLVVHPNNLNISQNRYVRLKGSGSEAIREIFKFFRSKALIEECIFLESSYDAMLFYKKIGFERVPSETAGEVLFSLTGAKLNQFLNPDIEFVKPAKPKFKSSQPFQAQ